jgi:hypothetical protein
MELQEVNAQNNQGLVNLMSIPSFDFSPFPLSIDLMTYELTRWTQNI